VLFDEAELLVYGKVEYEKRIVAFFDILGWRNEIELAGSNSGRIARLAVITKLFAAAVATTPDQFPGVRLTTFSDCAVVSVPYNPSILTQWIEAIGIIQSSLALLGFWIRGAVTIGDLLHDSTSVFGPTLNRAYELESQLAIYPRVLVDDSIPEDASVLIENENIMRFVDPFTIDFLNRFQSIPPNSAAINHFNSMSGASIGHTNFRLSGALILQIIFMRLSAHFESAPNDKIREKHAWWHNRLAPRVLASNFSISKLSLRDLGLSA
jgi:hypothetical protein